MQGSCGRVVLLLNAVQYQTGSHAVKTGRVQIKVTERMSSKDLGVFYGPTPTLAGPLCTYSLLWSANFLAQGDNRMLAENHWEVKWAQNYFVANSKKER